LVDMMKQVRSRTKHKSSPWNKKHSTQSTCPKDYVRGCW
jgi:hypothetical protein